MLDKRAKEPYQQAGRKSEPKFTINISMCKRATTADQHHSRKASHARKSTPRQRSKPLSGISIKGY
jgi:hypothetical protein